MRKITNFLNDKRNKPIRRLLIWIIPIMLFSIFFVPFYNTDSIQKIKGENKWEYNENPSFFTSIRNILDVPFNLKWSLFCFKDNNTKAVIVYINETTGIIAENSYPDMTLILNFNEQNKSYNIEKDTSFICEKVNLEKEFNFEIKIGTTFKANEKLTVIDIALIEGWEYKFIPEFWSFLTKLFLVFISWWALLWLITRMIYFCEYGIVKNTGNTR